MSWGRPFGQYQPIKGMSEEQARKIQGIAGDRNETVNWSRDLKTGQVYVETDTMPEIKLEDYQPRART